MTMTNLSQLTITDPHTWTKDELYINLQAAVDVELWTIPLYLTALYSIQSVVYKNSGSQENYPIYAKWIESVVIEEMLHLQLACNVCNALGYIPQMNSPSYDETDGIPFLKENVPDKYQGFQVRLGGFDENQLKLFCVIELPEPQTNPDWSTQTKYNSIGELYQALEIAVTNLWDELYVGNINNQQANFSDYLSKYQKDPADGFSQIVSSLESALAAMQAIVGQGEGSSSTNEIPAQDQPPGEPSAPSGYDPSDFDPADSHFVKFNDALDWIQTNSTAGITYPIIPNPNKQQLAEQAQASIELMQSFKGFLGALEDGFSNPQPCNQLPASFFKSMFAMQTNITAVWQTGAVPVFTGKIYPGS